MPPLAARVVAYGLLTVPLGSDVVVIASGLAAAALMVNVKAFDVAFFQFITETAALPAVAMSPLRIEARS